MNYTTDALNDQIKSLPGAEKLDVTFNQFSGYLAIDGAQPGSKKMHYWLTESMSDPSRDPLTFWTNGGPGCSGLIGAMTEMGPFRPNKDLTLSLNPYAWNQKANMVYIEQPCGVGFSYSDEEADYKADDASAAADNYALIQAFLTRFPQYSQSSLYITAESYGGHYMPTLAKEIVDQNTAGKNPKLNFKGFAVGNPFTMVYSGLPASLETYWGHQVVPKPMWDNYTATCIDPKVPRLEKCEDLLLEMMGKTRDMNPYALDYPVCTEKSAAKYGSHQSWLMMRNAMKASGVSERVLKALKMSDSDVYVPCADDYASNYLNQANVKEALHVKSDISWIDCSHTLKYSQTDSFNSMVPYYQYLINGNYGLDILVYSGDDDSVCGTVGTQKWIWSLGYDWYRPYWVPYKIDGQLGGYLTKFNNNTRLAFATVHGAGHEVPTYKGQAALFLFNAYLSGALTNPQSQ